MWSRGELRYDKVCEKGDHLSTQAQSPKTKPIKPGMYSLFNRQNVRLKNSIHFSSKLCYIRDKNANWPKRWNGIQVDSNFHIKYFQTKSLTLCINTKLVENEKFPFSEEGFYMMSIYPIYIISILDHSAGSKLVSFLYT